MSVSVPLIALLLIAPAQGERGSAPRAVAQAAIHAVESDSAPVLRAAFGRRLREHPSDPAALLGLATLARLTYDFRAADSLYQALLAGGVAPAWRAAAEIGAARSAIAAARFGRADALLVAAAARALAADDSSGATEALLTRAGVLLRTRGVAAADSALIRARRLAPAREAELSAELACTAAGVARAAERADALELAWRGAAAAARVRAPRVGAACLGVAAAALGVRLGSDSALAVYDRAIGLARTAHDGATVASLLQWRGYLRRIVLDLGGAQHDLLAAVREGDVAGNRSAVAWALLNLGLLAASVNDVEQGRAFARRAVAALRAQGDLRGLEVAQQLDAGLTLRAGNVGTAERLYHEARATAEQLGAHGDLVWITSSLGRIALARGDDRAATRWLERARAEAHAAHDASAEAGLTYHFGMVALRRGDYGAAQALFATDLRDGSIHAQFRSWARLAEIAVLAGRVDDGERELWAALDALDSARAQLSQREFRLRVLDATLDYLDPDLGTATVVAAVARSGRAARALELAERRRAQELLDELMRRDALRTAPPNAGLDNRAFDLAALQRGLTARGSALLFFVTGMGGEPTTVFVAAAGGVHAFAAPPIDSLVSQVAAFRDQVEDGLPAPVLGRVLAAALLDSALASLAPEARTIVLVPDHGLFDLPFDALSLPDGRPVAARYATSTAPSAGVLLRLWEAPPAPSSTARVFAMGDPDLAPRAGDVAAPGASMLWDAFAGAGGLRRLPAARREVRAVGQFAPQAEIRMGRAASEAWLRGAALRDFRVLHFATHALVSDQSLSRTGLALAPGGGEDGFLGPEDIATLQLDADLVVLSACRTARGVPLLGEGIRGLAAPLVEAGARAVVATAWDVPDGPMVPLMRDFYAALASGASIAGALQRAKTAARERGASPRVWAALTVYGDGARRVPLGMPGPRAARSWWVASLMALAGAAALVAFRWRRVSAPR